jgi:spermidine/putrescine transport system permease protein
MTAGPIWLRIFGRVYLAVIVLFLFAPVILLAIFAFNKSPFFTLPLKWFTFHWFSVAYHNQAMMTSLRNSVEIAALTAVTSTTLSFIAALGLRQATSRIRRAADFVLPLPLLVPSLIWSIALLLTISKLHLLPSVWTVYLGHVLLTIPFVFLLVTIRVSNFNPEWAEAADSLGAGRWLFIRRVFFPHVAPALVAGALMAFTISFNDFIVAYFLTGTGFNTLPVYIYSYIQNISDPSIAAVSTAVFAFALTLFLVAVALQGRELVSESIRVDSGRGLPGSAPEFVA